MFGIEMFLVAVKLSSAEPPERFTVKTVQTKKSSWEFSRAH